MRRWPSTHRRRRLTKAVTYLSKTSDASAFVIFPHGLAWLAARKQTRPFKPWSGRPAPCSKQPVERAGRPNKIALLPRHLVKAWLAAIEISLGGKL
jgi:hypothetical protein